MKAEEEAWEFCTEGTEYLGYAMDCLIFDPPAKGQEVFSLMRVSRISPVKYISSLFATGRERAQ